MERSDEDEPEDCACPCCGVAITAYCLGEVGECHRCAGYPYHHGGGCGKRHGDALRIWSFNMVTSGKIRPWEGIALCAADDAHIAGKMAWVDGREVITEPAPDPGAWDRLMRIRSVDRTIREVVTTFVGPTATQKWDPKLCRALMLDRLGRLSRAAGSCGIWRVSVEAPNQIEIEPPSDYIQTRSGTDEVLVPGARANA